MDNASTFVSAVYVFYTRAKSCIISSYTETHLLSEKIVGAVDILFYAAA